MNPDVLLGVESHAPADEVVGPEDDCYVIRITAFYQTVSRRQYPSIVGQGTAALVEAVDAQRSLIRIGGHLGVPAAHHSTQ